MIVGARLPTNPTSSKTEALFRRVREGDRSALEELMPLVYGDLRRIAGSFMGRQRPGHTLQPTALVNEALVKLFEDGRLELADRAHFLALMARIMRQVLVDHARAASAAKRGGGRRLAWDSTIEDVAERGATVAVLELHGALDALAREDPTLAEIVEMRYFAGMTAEETALVVGRSAHAVRHDLRLARAWLRRRLSG